MDIVTSLKAVCLFSRLNKRVSGRCHTLDMVWSRKKYNILYDYYFSFGMWNVPRRMRGMYICNNNGQYVRRYNPGVTNDSHTLKSDITKKYERYLDRRIVPTEGLDFDAFKAFVGDSSSFFYKPEEGSSGKGIEKISIPNWGGSAS